MTSIPAAFQAFLSKSAAVALLATVVSVIAFGVVFPVRDQFRDIDGRIAGQRSLLGRYMAENKAAITTGGAGNQEMSGTENAAFLSGETDALRLASLQATLNNAASLEKIRLASAQALDSSDDNGVRFLSLRAQLSAELEPLQKMLFHLEKEQPYLIVDGLRIARAPEGGAAHMPGLDVTLLLRGAAPKKKE